MSGARARSKTGTSASCVGIELEQGDAVAREQFVEHVEHRDRGDVAGAEHQSDASGGRRCQLAETGRALGILGGDAGLEPHLARESRQQQAVDGAEREHVGAQAAAGRGIRLHALERAVALRERQQGRAVRVERREHRVGSGEPLLTPQRMPGLERPSTWPRRRPTPRRRADTESCSRSTRRARCSSVRCDHVFRPDAEVGDRGVERGALALGERGVAARGTSA